MSTEAIRRVQQHAQGTLVGTYLSWYIACFQSGNS